MSTPVAATAWHRRGSWRRGLVAQPEARPAAPSAPRGTHKSGWLLLDNDGSYNGWFDGVPRHLRVGPWSPIAVAVLLSFAVALVVLKPPLSPLVHVAIPELYSAGWWRDAAVGTWGALVLARCVSVWGRWPMLVSYTGWSWNFLTLRAALGAAAPLLCAASPTPATPPSCAALGTAAVALGEGLRLAVGLQAFVVTSVWNVILFPFIALVLFSDPQKRRDFVRWNFGFELVQIHVLNVVYAYLSVGYGDAASGTRPFGLADLWCAYALFFAYACLYLLGLDRLGIHFYPPFSPRTHWCAATYPLVVGMYYGMYRAANAHLGSAPAG